MDRDDYGLVPAVDETAVAAIDRQYPFSHTSIFRAGDERVIPVDVDRIVSREWHTFAPGNPSVRTVEATEAEGIDPVTPRYIT